MSTFKGRGRTIRALALSAPLCLLALTSCGGADDPAPGEVLRSDGGTVLVMPEPGENDSYAGVGYFGRVQLVGDCLGIDDASIIWPHGTEIVSDNPFMIEVPGMGQVTVGDRVSGGGVNWSADRLPEGIDAIPPGCPTGSVYAFFPDRG